MSNSLLSFIIPVHNPELSILEKCVKSIIAQSLVSWEAIFVFNGIPCPDGVALVRRLFKKSKNHFKVLEIEGSGAPRARNWGERHAAGEYLCFWDADCCIEPGASQNWVNIFNKKPDIGFIYSGYKFFGEKFAIDSEEFDPYTLKVRNYISTCFPLRRSLYPGWCEDLASLQDWDFWLSVVEKAEQSGYDKNRVGLFLRGYAFSTAMPSHDSISAKGCTPQVWLERLEAVKSRHGIPVNTVCVSSLQYKNDGLALAKLIGADYQDYPNDKPNRYTQFIQIGFSLSASMSERHASIFQKPDTDTFLFWTGDNINEIYHSVSFSAIDTYAQILNKRTLQFVEDLEAKRLIERAGFKVEVMQFPMVADGAPSHFPDRPRFAVDIAEVYGPLFGAIERSVPDMDLDVVTGMTSLGEYNGILHFYPDRTLSGTVKRALLSGRHVISNIAQPFCGYISDKESHEKFIVGIAAKLRDVSDQPLNEKARDYYKTALDPKIFKERLCAAQ